MFRNIAILLSTLVAIVGRYELKKNSHQILKLVERKMQGLVSFCRKPTVQTVIEAENLQGVVQMIPRMLAKSYSLEATTLGFG